MKKRLFLLFILIFGLPLAAAALAQNAAEPARSELPPAEELEIADEKKLSVDILPQMEAADYGLIVDMSQPTHPPLKMTPDKSELVKLERDAGTVIVGNPAHLNVLADSGTTLIIVPRIPGASFFSVLDEESNIIMQRHVLVAAPKQNYVRVRRTCNADNEACRPTSVYYCPDMCHEIALPMGESEDGGSDAGNAAEGGSDMANAGPPPVDAQPAPQ